MITRVTFGILSAVATIGTLAGVSLAQDAAQGPDLNRAGASEPKVVDVTSARRDFFTANPAADFFERGDRITRVYGRAFSHGSGPSQSAAVFIRDHADVWGVRSNDLVPVGAFLDATHSVDVYWDAATESYRFTLLGYSQVVDGIPVFRSVLKLLLRNEPGFPLVLASSDLRDLGAFPSTLAARPTLASFDRMTWSSQAIRVAAIAEPTDAQLVIFAGVDDSPASPTLAVRFEVVRGIPGAGFSKMLYVTEATTGKILFEEEQVCNADIVGTVRAMATTGWAADACSPEVPTGMPHAAISVGGTTIHADANGSFTFPNGEGDVLSLTSDLALAGKYFKVNDVSGTPATITLSGTGEVPVDFLHNEANLTENDRAEVNAYIHANAARDYIIAANPNFPTIAGQQLATAFQIHVNYAATCNAYYDGPSINFYLSGGNCNNTGFATVVHHEYGHHLCAAGGSGQGAYGEGMGDVLGALISETSALAVGFQNCANGIRDAANSCQFASSGCSSCGSTIHACGQLISGCLWDTRLNLAAVEPANFRTIIRNLAVNSVLLHTGSTIAGDITIDYLTLDDENGDLTDGSPHYAQIDGGFAAHGLPGPVISPLKFTIPNGIPAYAAPNTTLALSVQVTALAGEPQPNTGKLYWRVGTGAYQYVSMTQTSSNIYSAQIPMGACGLSTDFYFEAQTITNQVVTDPTTAPSAFHTSTSGYGIDTTFSDSFQLAGAWVVGSATDTATVAGVWTRVDPNGTIAQPEGDHTPNPGSICYVTGQGTAGSTSAGQADIDGGATTLTSPTFSAIDPSTTLSYWRWYSNNKGAAPNADSMPVQISGDNGATWVQMELVTENADAWVQKSFRVSDFIAPSATVKVRFVPSDFASGSLVEGGLDDFIVRAANCTPPAHPADLNGDTYVNGIDLAIVLGGWGTLAGDIDHNGTTDGGDLAALLSAWTG